VEVVYMSRLIFSLFAVALCLAVPVADAGRLTSQLNRSALHSAGDTATLTGLERDSYRLLVVGAAVPGDRPAQCQARLLGAGGVVLEETTLEVEAGSSAQFDFAGHSGLGMAADAQVSCNQPFHAYAAAAGQNEPKVVWGEGSGPTVKCKPENKLGMSAPEPGIFEARMPGFIHRPTVNEPVLTVCFKAPNDLSLNTLIAEWDVIPGQWNEAYPAGSHNLIYLHRGTYAGHMVGSVSAFGEGAGEVKNYILMSQNIDLPPKALPTRPTAKGKINNANLVLGGTTTYHLRYIYDALNQTATFEILKDGETQPRRMTMKATAKDRILRISRDNRWDNDGSLFVEFGHFGEKLPRKDYPAVQTYGWTYSNLSIKMYQK
jgi:hypothetical protein